MTGWIAGHEDDLSVYFALHTAGLALTSREWERKGTFQFDLTDAPMIGK